MIRSCALKPRKLVSIHVKRITVFFFCQDRTICCIFELGGVTKHLMTDPRGNTKFFFPRPPMFPSAFTSATIKGNKTHCFPWVQSLSSYYPTGQALLALFGKTKKKSLFRRLTMLKRLTGSSVVLSCGSNCFSIIYDCFFLIPKETHDLKVKPIMSLVLAHSFFFFFVAWREIFVKALGKSPILIVQSHGSMCTRGFSESDVKTIIK